MSKLKELGPDLDSYSEKLCGHHGPWG